eukprot:COSAG01_NODE_9347_length_2476_cov_1.586454_3_plen_151_part_00
MQHPFVVRGVGLRACVRAGLTLPRVCLMPEYYSVNGSLTCRRQQTQYGVTCDAGCAPYLSASCGEGGDPLHNGCSNCQRDVCNDGGGAPVEWSPALWKNASADSGAPHMIFHADSYSAIGAAPNNHSSPDVAAVQREIMTNGPGRCQSPL